jgi:hypothetical protein
MRPPSPAPQRAHPRPAPPAQLLVRNASSPARRILSSACSPTRQRPRRCTLAASRQAALRHCQAQAPSRHWRDRPASSQALAHCSSQLQAAQHGCTRLRLRDHRSSELARPRLILWICDLKFRLIIYLVVILYLIIYLWFEVWFNLKFYEFVIWFLSCFLCHIKHQLYFFVWFKFFVIVLT